MKRDHVPERALMSMRFSGLNERVGDGLKAAPQRKRQISRHLSMHGMHGQRHISRPRRTASVTRRLRLKLTCVESDMLLCRQSIQHASRWEATSISDPYSVSHVILSLSLRMSLSCSHWVRTNQGGAGSNKPSPSDGGCSFYLWKSDRLRSIAEGEE